MIVLRYMAGVYLGGCVMFKCYWDMVTNVIVLS